jgi:hypothetical protein
MWQRLQVRFIVAELFGAAMQPANMRIDLLNNLAVEFDHKVQGWLSSRMLRAEVDGETPKLLLHAGLDRPRACQRRGIPEELSRQGSRRTLGCLNTIEHGRCLSIDLFIHPGGTWLQISASVNACTQPHRTYRALKLIIG